MGVLQDAQLDGGGVLKSAYFSNCGMGTIWGQDMFRGHGMFAPLVEEGLFPERVPIFNVEGACASGSMAFHLAWKDVLCGVNDVSLAMGMDKFYHPDMQRVLTAFENGIDREDKDRLIGEYQAVADACCQQFMFGQNRTILLDTYAMQACWHRNDNRKLTTFDNRLLTTPCYVNIKG